MDREGKLISLVALSSSIATLGVVFICQSNYLSRFLSSYNIYPFGAFQKRRLGKEHGKLSYAVIGDAFVDVLAPGVKDLPKWNSDSLAASPVALHPGGSALNTAVHLRELCGQKVCLHTALGNDDFGSFLIAALQRRGLDLVNHYTSEKKKGKKNDVSRFLSSGRKNSFCLKKKHEESTIARADAEIGTGACLVISGPNDRAFVTHRGVINALSIKCAQTVAQGVSHLHIAGYYNCPCLQADVPELLRAARLNGATTSMGVQHDYSGCWSGIGKAPLLVQNNSAGCAPDFLILSEDEARSIVLNLRGDSLKAHALDAEQDATTLLTRGAAVLAVVITVGAKGAIAAARRYPGSRLIIVKQQAAPISPEAFVDATGAGDAFAAGFIAGIHCLSSWNEADPSPRSLRRALILGCAAGASCVSNLGASAPLLQENLRANITALYKLNEQLSSDLPDLMFHLDASK